jgi:zinc ribbon protein
MICRNCGAEIADKALICYRCGTATTEPTFKPPAQQRPRRSALGLVTTVLALALLVLVALYVGRAPTGQTPRLVTEIAVGIAVLIVALRAYARRR